MESKSENNWNPFSVPPASGLCTDCLQDREQTGTNGRFIVSYCQHNSAGALMALDQDGNRSGYWIIYTPITAEEFIGKVQGLMLSSLQIAFAKQGGAGSA